jgi:hypothetical protein
MDRRLLGHSLACLCTLFLVQGCKVIPPDEQDRNIPFEEIRNHWLLIQDKHLVVIRDTDQLETLWKSGHADVAHAPKVDFSKHMMLGLFFGQYRFIERPRVSISSIQRRSNPDRIDVTYEVREWKPQWPGGVTVHGASSLQILALIPRTDLPVNFIEKQEKW